MTTQLTNEEKASIVNQHKRNVENQKYNLELSIMQENAVTVPNEDLISSLNSQKADLDKKIAALDAELVTLS